MARDFAKMLIKVAANSQITGLLQSMNNIGAINMHYVDDTILFLETELNTTFKLK
jgi:hypothetical protein